MYTRAQNWLNDVYRSVLSRMRRNEWMMANPQISKLDTLEQRVFLSATHTSLDVDPENDPIKFAAYSNNQEGAIDVAVSGNGRFMVYTRVKPTDSIYDTQIYRRDLLTGDTILISHNAMGEDGNDHSFGASINDDGTVITFTTHADDIDGSGGNKSQIIKWSMDSKGEETFEMISVDSNGAAGDDDSYLSKVSGDGNVVGFVTDADLGEYDNGYGGYGYGDDGISRTFERGLYVYEDESLTLLKEPNDPGDGIDWAINDFDINQDGSKFIVSVNDDDNDDDDGIFIWNAAAGDTPSSGNYLETTSGAPDDVAISDDASVAVYLRDGDIHLKDGAQSVSTLADITGTPIEVDLSNDGTEIVWATSAGDIYYRKLSETNNDILIDRVNGLSSNGDSYGIAFTGAALAFESRATDLSDSDGFADPDAYYMLALGDVSYDWDIDGIHEVGADVDSWGFDTGSFQIDAYHQKSMLYLPLYTQWNELNVNHYLTQGAGDDQNIMLSTASRLMHVELDLPNNTKFAYVLRPSGALVEFEFEYDTQTSTFNDYAFATTKGGNEKRTYVLREFDDGYGNLSYELHFANGIIHHFDDDAGSISRISHNDGRFMDINSPGMFGSVGGDRYDVTLVWEDGCLKAVEYGDRNTSSKITVDVIDNSDNGYVDALDKSVEYANTVNFASGMQYEDVFDFTTFTSLASVDVKQGKYQGGAIDATNSITRVRYGGTASDGVNTVTFTENIYDQTQADRATSRKLNFNADEQITKSTDEYGIETVYTYFGSYSSGRYQYNQAAKWSKVKKIERKIEGKTVDWTRYKVDGNTGWVTEAYTPFNNASVGTGNSGRRKVKYTITDWRNDLALRKLQSALPEKEVHSINGKTVTTLDHEYNDVSGIYDERVTTQTRADFAKKLKTTYKRNGLGYTQTVEDEDTNTQISKTVVSANYGGLTSSTSTSVYGKDDDTEDMDAAPLISYSQQTMSHSDGRVIGQTEKYHEATTINRQSSSETYGFGRYAITTDAVTPNTTFDDYNAFGATKVTNHDGSISISEEIAIDGLARKVTTYHDGLETGSKHYSEAIYTYDNWGRITKQQVTNYVADSDGNVGDGRLVTTDYEYYESGDGRGRLESERTYDALNTGDVETNYTYSIASNGQLTTTVDLPPQGGHQQKRITKTNVDGSLASVEVRDGATTIEKTVYTHSMGAAYASAGTGGLKTEAVETIYDANGADKGDRTTNTYVNDFGKVYKTELLNAFGSTTLTTINTYNYDGTLEKSNGIDGLDTEYTYTDRLEWETIKRGADETKREISAEIGTTVTTTITQVSEDGQASQPTASDQVSVTSVSFSGNNKSTSTSTINGRTYTSEYEWTGTGDAISKLTRPDGTTTEETITDGLTRNYKDDKIHGTLSGTSYDYVDGGFQSNVTDAFIDLDMTNHTMFGQAQNTASQLSDGRTTTSVFDDNGLLQSYTRQDGKTQTLLYDAWGNVDDVDGAGAFENNTITNSDGQVTQLNTDGDTKDTTWEYDDATGLPIEKRIEGHTVEQYSYNNQGYLTQITRGVKTVDGLTGDVTTETLAYLGNGRLNTRTITGPDSATITYKYIYDGIGRVHQIQENGVTITTYHYVTGTVNQDLLESEVVIRDGVTTTTAYTYTSTGQLDTQKTTVAGQLIKDLKFHYDDSERVNKVEQVDGGRTFDWVYEDGLQALKTLNASLDNGSAFKVENTRDAVGRISDQSTTVAGSEVAGLDYTVDRDGDGYVGYTKLDKQDDVTLSFTDPVTGQKQEWAWVYTYTTDPSSPNYNPNSADQLSEARLIDLATGQAIPGMTFTYEYDAIGNRTKQITDDGTTLYSSNDRNELDQIDHGGLLQTIVIKGQADPGEYVTVNGVEAERDGSFYYATISTVGMAGTYMNVQIVKTKSDVVLGAGDDTFYAGPGDQVVRGGDGDDRLYGEDGDDILIGGDGHEWIYGGFGNNILIGGPGFDRFYGSNGSNDVDHIYADTRTSVTDTSRNDMYSGGGNDFMYGGYGRDIYHFYVGYGHDTIFEGDWANSTIDELHFRSNDPLVNDINPEDITFKRNGNDLVLEVGTSGTDSVTLVDWYVSGSTYNSVDSVYFGESFELVWDKQDLIDRSNGIISMGEVDTIQVDSSVQTVTLERSYQNAVVIANLASEDGGDDEASVRVSNVTGTSFDIQLTEPSNRDGVHVAETVTYMVFEAGVYTLADGRILEVGSFSTDATKGNRTPSGDEAWYTHTFSAAFTDDPIVISQIQTVNNDFSDVKNKYVKLRMRNVATSDFDIALEGEENKTYVFTEEETIGFMAISSGAGIWSGLKTEALSQNINNNATTINFTQNFTQDPGVIASLMTYNAADTVAVRMTDVNEDSTSLRAEEDQTKDNATGHTNEKAGVFAIEGKGILSVASDSMIPAGELQGFGELELLQTLVDGDPGLSRLESPHDMVISSDGKHAYAVARDDNAIVIFDRDLDTGELTHNKTLYDGGYDGFGNQLVFLDQPTAIEISNDGSRVYVGTWNPGSIYSFVRHSDTGELEYESVLGAGVKSSLKQIRNIRVSSDDQQIYVTSYSNDSVAIFQQNASGQFYDTNVYKDGTGSITGLNGAYGISLSPDGNHLYVTGHVDDAITVFETGEDQSNDANLTLVEEFKNGDLIDDANSAGQVTLNALDGARFVEVSPDGSHVYVTGTVDNSVAVFKRDSSTGTLSLVEVLYQGQLDSYGQAVPRLDAHGMKISGDGEHVYVSAFGNDSLAVFRRDNSAASTSFGRLKYMGDYRHNFADGRMIDDITDTRSTISPDGQYVYAVGSHADGIGVFKRDDVTGNLTFVHSLEDGDLDKYGNQVSGLDGARNVVVSKDNRFVFVTAVVADGISVFRRDFQTGELVFVEALFNGGVDSEGNSITSMDGPLVLTLSADSQQLYVPTRYNNSLLVFDIDQVSGKLILNNAPLINGQGGVDGLHYVSHAYATPDGKHVYTTGHSGDELGVFSVNPDGSLSYETVLDDGGLDGNSNVVDGLDSPWSSVLSGDGDYLYVTGYDENSITVFKRNQATGHLTWEQTIKEGDDLGGGVSMDGLLNAIHVDISSNQDYVFVTANASHAISIFSRDHATGHLTWQETIKNGLVDSYGNTVEGLINVRTLIVSPDGKHLYASGLHDRMLAFEIDNATGQLRLIDSERQSFRSSGNTIEGLDGSFFVTESPDGKNIYALGTNSEAISVFGRVDKNFASGDNYVRYGATDDDFQGQAGDDVVIGGDGLNYGNLSSGNDLYIGGNDRDDVRGGAGNDVLIGGLGGDILYGGDGDDYIHASFRTDASDPNNGDWMSGNGGNDHIYGDSGDDAYYFHVGDGHDHMYEVDVVTSDYDRLRFMHNIVEEDITMRRRASDLILEVKDENNTVTLVDWYASGSDYNSIDHIFFDNQTIGGWDKQAIWDRAHNAVDDSAGIGEVGTIQVNDQVQTVVMERNYINPVVIAQTAGMNDATPITVRVSDVRGASFKIQLTEASDGDNIHADETVTYMVFEAGTYTLADGRLLEVGTFDSGVVANKTFHPVTLFSDFATTPIVLGQVQTMSNGAGVYDRYIQTRIKDVTKDSFSIGLEAEEARNTNLQSERIGYMVLTADKGDWSGFKTDAIRTAAVVDEVAATINFTETFTETPGILGSLQTINGPDTSGMRYTSVSTTDTVLLGMEDTSLDPETAHSDEVAGVLAIQGSGILGTGGSGVTSSTTENRLIYIPSNTDTIANDSRGNRLNNGVFNYDWDNEDRLIEVESASFVPDSEKVRVTFEYDEQGRRTDKYVEYHDGVSYYDAEHIKFVYDGMLLVAELDGSDDSVMVSYLWMPGVEDSGGIGGLLEIKDHGTGKTYIPTYDGNGNVVQLVDATNGNVVAAYVYSPYGELAFESYKEGFNQNLNTFLFSTKYFDREIGLYYYGYRYYDPETGTWLNKDPIQEDGGLNTSAFVMNDPVNYVDAWGLEVDFMGSDGSGAGSGRKTSLSAEELIMKFKAEEKLLRISSEIQNAESLNFQAVINAANLKHNPNMSKAVIKAFSMLGTIGGDKKAANEFAVEKVADLGLEYAGLKGIHEVYTNLLQTAGSSPSPEWIANKLIGEVKEGANLDVKSFTHLARKDDMFRFEGTKKRFSGDDVAIYTEWVKGSTEIHVLRGTAHGQHNRVSAGSIESIWNTLGYLYIESMQAKEAKLKSDKEWITYAWSAYMKALVEYDNWLEELGDGRDYFGVTKRLESKLNYHASHWSEKRASIKSLEESIRRSKGGLR